AFLDGLRRAFDEVLGLLEAELGDRPDFLDDADLVVARGGEHDRELGLLLGRSGGGPTGGRSGGYGDGSGGANAPLFFEILDETGDFEDRLAAQPVDDLIFRDGGHVCFREWLASADGH